MQMKRDRDLSRARGAKARLSFFAFALATVVGGSACAATEINWFNGNIGGAAVGGSWTDPRPEGVTLSGTRYVISEPEDDFGFTATTPTAPCDYTNLIVRLTAKFGYAYEDAYPELTGDPKIAIAACSFSPTATNYHVLAKDPNGTTNMWVNTQIDANVAQDVDVVITVSSNANDSVAKVTYKFGDAEFGPNNLVVASAFSTFSCAGEGELAALTGKFTENWVPPAGKQIPAAAKDDVEAWAEKNNVSATEFATKTMDNGLTAYQSCMLGLDNNETLVATANVAAAVGSITIAVKPPLANVGTKVEYVLSKAGAENRTSNTGSFSDVTLGTGREIFSVQAKVDGSNAGSATQVGSQAVTVSNTGAFVPVPWTNWEKDPVKASALINGASENDQIDIFNGSDLSWTTVKYTGNAWGLAGGKTEEPVLKRGSAFKYTGNGIIHLVGGADATAATSTQITKGQFNLVGNPNGESFDLKNGWLADGDRVITKTASTGLPETTFIKFNGEWVKKTPGQAPETNEVSKTVTEFGANTGFFLKSSTSESITWGSGN